MSRETQLTNDAVKLHKKTIVQQASPMYASFCAMNIGGFRAPSGRATTQSPMLRRVRNSFTAVGCMAVTFALLSSTSNAQDSWTTQYQWPEGGREVVIGMSPVSDGGAVVAFEASQAQNGIRLLVIVRFGVTGEVQWSQRIDSVPIGDASTRELVRYGDDRWMLMYEGTSGPGANSRALMGAAFRLDSGSVEIRVLWPIRSAGAFCGVAEDGNQLWCLIVDERALGLLKCSDRAEVRYHAIATGVAHEPMGHVAIAADRVVIQSAVPIGAIRRKIVEYAVSMDGEMLWDEVLGLDSVAANFPLGIIVDNDRVISAGALGTTGQHYHGETWTRRLATGELIGRTLLDSQIVAQPVPMTVTSSGVAIAASDYNHTFGVLGQSQEWVWRKSRVMSSASGPPIESLTASGAGVLMFFNDTAASGRRSAATLAYFDEKGNESVLWRAPEWSYARKVTSIPSRGVWLSAELYVRMTTGDGNGLIVHWQRSNVAAIPSKGFASVATPRSLRIAARRITVRGDPGDVRVFDLLGQDLTTNVQMSYRNSEDLVLELHDHREAVVLVELTNRSGRHEMIVWSITR